MQQLSLLGRDYTALGDLAQRGLEGASACLSAGSDPDSPSFAYKGDKAFPNEDGLLILKEGSRWLFAVADGHLGHGCSHSLLESLSQPRQGLPTRPGQLALWLSNIEWPDDALGGTTLVAACLEETTGEVFGFSFGDSSIVTLGPAAPRVHNRLNDVYLRAEQQIPMEFAVPFRFQMTAGEALLIYTDGVNECCYRDPFRSVQLNHLHELHIQNPGAAALARAVTELALRGVDDSPGGQDNVALIAWRHGEIPTTSPDGAPLSKV